MKTWYEVYTCPTDKLPATLAATYNTLSEIAPALRNTTRYFIIRCTRERIQPEAEKA